MKKTIRLTESDLHRIVKESVKKLMKESFLDKSWDERISSDDFWGESPEQIHSKLLKLGYCVGMPQKDVLDLIEWARGMFFLPIDMPKPTRDKVLNIIINKLRGNKFEPNSNNPMVMNTRLENGNVYGSNNSY